MLIFCLSLQKTQQDVIFMLYLYFHINLFNFYTS